MAGILVGPELRSRFLPFEGCSFWSGTSHFPYTTTCGRWVVVPKTTDFKVNWGQNGSQTDKLLIMLVVTNVLKHIQRKLHTIFHAPTTCGRWVVVLQPLIWKLIGDNNMAHTQMNCGSNNYPNKASVRFYQIPNFWKSICCTTLPRKQIAEFAFLGV
jgi:hypothetical protein